jgi:signal transduction histidine kinase
MKTTRKDNVQSAAKTADRIRALEQELAKQADVKRQNAETWREAVHDLRGFLGVIKNSITALNRENVPEPHRGEFAAMLRDSIAAMNAVLNDLSCLASLQAGHEQCKVGSFDANAVINELCEELQPVAAGRGLLLNAPGAATLTVDGDAGKVRRIVTNLVQIALHSIKRGAVTVTCEKCAADGFGLWTLRVQWTEADTEPEPKRAPGSGTKPLAQLPSAAIARSIVQGLCDLLGANLQSDADVGKGNAFIVTFPRRLDADPAQGSTS